MLRSLLRDEQRCRLLLSITRHSDDTRRTEPRRVAEWSTEDGSRSRQVLDMGGLHCTARRWGPLSADDLCRVVLTTGRLGSLKTVITVYTYTADTPASVPQSTVVDFSFTDARLDAGEFNTKQNVGFVQTELCRTIIPFAQLSMHRMLPFHAPEVSAL